MARRLWNIDHFNIGIKIKGQTIRIRAESCTKWMNKIYEN